MLPLLLVVLAGCKTWEATPARPDDLFAGGGPSRVRLTLLEGDPLVLRDPTLSNDTISGALEMPGSPRHGATTRVPVEYVRRVELRTKTDVAASVAAVAVGGLVGGFVVLLLFFASAAD